MLSSTRTDGLLCHSSKNEPAVLAHGLSAFWRTSAEAVRTSESSTVVFAGVVADVVATLVRGTVGYGGMGNSETVLLQLAAGEGSPYKVLSVIAVWRQIARTAEPESFKGKIVEVQTTPQVVGGNHVKMMISAAMQLRVVLRVIKRQISLDSPPRIRILPR
jgi:hypothetical protein